MLITIVIDDVLNNNKLKLLVVELDKVANIHNNETNVSILDNAFKSAVVKILNINVGRIKVLFDCLFLCK